MPAHTGSFSEPLPPGFFFPQPLRLHEEVPALSRAGLVALIGLLAVAGLWLVTNVSAPQHDVTPATTRSFSITVPARIVANFFIVESRSAAGEVHNFVIDTGSTTTLVSAEFAARHAIHPDIALRTEIFAPDGQRVEKARVTVPRLQLGRAQFANVSAVVSDLDEISRHLGLRVDGIVGFPVFKHYRLTLDYGRGSMKIAVATPEGDLSNRGLVFPIRGDGQLPFVTLHVAGQSSDVLIDSGGDGGINLNPENLRLRLRGPAREGALVATVAGQRRQYLGRMAHEVAIGGVNLAEPVVDFTLGVSSVGGELLKNFVLTFDQRRHEVTFRRVTAGPIKMEARRSVGVSFARGAGAWQVAGIVPETPSADSTLQTGDECVRINGEAVDQWPAERYAALLARAENVTFTIARGGQQTDLELPVVSLLE